MRGPQQCTQRRLLRIRDESVHLPFLSRQCKTCAKLHTDSGPLRVWLSRPRSAFPMPSMGSRHLILLWLGACRSCSHSGKHLERLHGAALLPLRWDLQRSSPRPVPDGFGGRTSKAISNFPPRRTKLITSPVLRCSAQLPSAVRRTSWPVANRSLPAAVSAQEPREPSEFASSRQP